jgi:hypothetical protein
MTVFEGEADTPIGQTHFSFCLDTDIGPDDGPLVARDKMTLALFQLERTV